MATPLPVIRTEFTLAEVCEATGGVVHGNPSLRLHGVCTDTRALTPGCLFIALVGERFDAHHHLYDAMTRGASALLVRRGAMPAGAAGVEVDDTLRALGDLARFHLRRCRPNGLRVAAISGAVGKTTTKELTAAAFGAAFGTTLATPGNLNNVIGTPLTLLTLTEAHHAAVIECGSNAPGEIARLGAIVSPDVALVTNADAAHTEGLGSIEGVAREEGSLFGFASRAVVGNADEPLSAAQMTRAGDGVVRRYFGLGPKADARVRERVLGRDGRARIRVRIVEELCPGAGVVEVITALVGPMVSTNVSAALAVTAAAGADAEALHRAAAAMGTVAAVPGRLDLVVIPWAHGTVRLLDDTYNSSPRALRAALDAAGELAGHGASRLVVALGDMLELGALSEIEHDRAGDLVTASGAAVFVGVGEAMARAVDRARVSNRVHCRDSVEAAGVLVNLVQAGDVVLLKGSRGTRMERCVAALRGTEA